MTDAFRRIVLSARRDLFAVPGGDTLQIAETAAALRRRGMDTDVQLGRLSTRSGDVVHLFNITRVHDTLSRSREARLSGTPTVVMPIHHALRWVDAYEREVRSGIPGALSRSTGRDLRELLKAGSHAACSPNQVSDVLAMARIGYSAAQREVLNSASMVICNSRQELQVLRAETAYSGPAAVSYLGLSSAFWEAMHNPGPRPSDIPDEPFVLSVGRIEPRKNQLATVAAARQLGLGLVLIGAVSRLSPGYSREVMREARGLKFLKYVPWVSQGDLVHWYGSATVHVLASWFETVGLVTLEAAACGCPTVSTSRSYVGEYLGESCVMFDPAGPARLADVIGGIAVLPRLGAVAARQAKSFTWDAAAEALLQAYDEAWTGHV